MADTLARTDIVFISLLSVAAFVPGIARWYRHRHDRVARYDQRFRLQHLSHLILFIHHVLVVLMLLGIDPFALIPDTLRAVGSVHRAVILSGFGLFAVGNALRIRAAYYMGESVDKTVLVRTNHQLSTNGPYCLSRHSILVGCWRNRDLESPCTVGHWSGTPC